MFNFTTENCVKCKEEFLMSLSEKEMFERGYCSVCIDPKVRHLRALAVMGFYDISSVNEQIAECILDKDLERRKSPRITLRTKP